METVETITIKSPNGPVRINATDFKVGTHELADEAEDAGKIDENSGNGQPGQPAAPQAPVGQPGQPPRGAAKPA
jgi:hypothetical protein